MQYIIYICFIFFYIISCTNNKNIKPNIEKLLVHDTIYVNKLINNNHNWQEGLKLTHNPDLDTVNYMPVRYYLNNKNCSGLAKDFYYGTFRPSDNYSTNELLKLSYTNDSQLRPFYRWCLNTTIDIADGALWEHIGIPARKYFEKFPKEAIQFVERDTTKERYNNWVEAITYSGYYDTDSVGQNEKTRASFYKEMIKNCKDCDKNIISKIKIFSEDCYKN